MHFKWSGNVPPCHPNWLIAVSEKAASWKLLLRYPTLLGKFQENFQALSKTDWEKKKGRENGNSCSVCSPSRLLSLSSFYWLSQALLKLAPVVGKLSSCSCFAIAWAFLDEFSYNRIKRVICITFKRCTPHRTCGSFCSCSQSLVFPAVRAGRRSNCR